MFEFLSDIVDAVIDIFDGDTPDATDTHGNAGNAGTSPSGTTGTPANDSSHGVQFGASAGCDCGYNPNNCGAGWACRFQY